jgi:RNA exonuclease 4
MKTNRRDFISFQYKTRAKLIINNFSCRITKYVALDCEMVGVGPEGEESMLARVLIVNAYGNVIYDKFVAARETVTDYRTHVSGIRPEDLLGGLIFFHSQSFQQFSYNEIFLWLFIFLAPTFEEVQKDVAQLIKGRIVVGHALENDFKVWSDFLYLL